MLSVEAVSKTFGGVQALRNASLSCEAGEILGLIGPNGAGKSTLVNAISGVLKPDTGSVRLAGQEITGHGPEHCARAGVARTARTGAGLGLSIVQAAVRAHGGTVRAEPVPGGGLAVTVVLPAGA